jgi:hypothetical protein
MQSLARSPKVWWYEHKPSAWTFCDDRRRNCRRQSLFPVGCLLAISLLAAVLLGSAGQPLALPHCRCMVRPPPPPRHETAWSSEPRPSNNYTLYPQLLTRLPSHRVRVLCRGGGGLLTQCESIEIISGRLGVYVVILVRMFGFSFVYVQLHNVGTSLWG